MIMRVRIRLHSYMECITQKKSIFTHIDFTKNQYGNDIYQSNIKIARMVYQLMPIRKAEVNTTKFGVSKTAHFQSKCGIC